PGGLRPESRRQVGWGQAWDGGTEFAMAVNTTTAPRSGSGAGRWGVLALLVAANTLSLLDRQLPFILVEDIRADLKLTDTQIGLLGGLAFSLTYALLGLPLARVADRWSRKWVMVACVGVWSIMTAAGGLARNFGQLAVSRTGVAVAEA